MMPQIRNPKFEIRNQRSRPLYVILMIAAAAAGIGSRVEGAGVPAFVAQYAGDVFWALFVYLGVGLLAPRLSIRRVVLIAGAVAAFDEVSQLYHAPWIDAVRQTGVGGLILGYGFLWSDFLCYLAGIALGMGGEYFLLRAKT